MEKLYKNYTADVAKYLQTGRKDSISKALSVRALNESESKLPWQDKIKNEMNFKSLSGLSDISGIAGNYNQKLGAHPDFTHLKDSNTIEYHYITTMFIDIKRSTELFKKYYPHAVANICRTIQDAAIHTCWYFGGYIHRLHGDGLMVYFGGKNITKQQSIDNALNASAFITYFVKNDLKDLFNEQGIERIYTRIGIDIGENEDVMWHLAGMGDCSEITTCSLHSSLASKMQAQTMSNGIMVGDNVITYQKAGKEYFKYQKYKVDGLERDYIFSIPDDSFYYKQHDFNWESYLKKHPSVETDEEGNLRFKGGNILPQNNISQNLPYLQKNVSDYKPYLK